MAKVFQFGETMPEYPVPVLNEREVRAGAGILFFAAMVGFFQAFLLGDFTVMRLVVLAFFVDFSIRVINPRYSPSLVLGRLMVHNQEPEYAGAPQKRFAWALGLVMATTVMVLVYGFNMAGPVVLAICMMCIGLMFFETAFGICIGCKLYNLVFREKAQLCPGGVCMLKTRAPITQTKRSQLAVAVLVIAGVLAAAPFVAQLEQPQRGSAVVATSATK
ncbi:DUF4395 domain-containing protein [Halomonas campisalis]|uniref:DUF4395 domain-containing protein n=1 Tax=Billgrantia campisalis TaxID=74661 RepID=A0ABS9P5U8_9GAMM|nr:DUF4395 domain-containing protein [Halomonas campisalis]MCG6656617.1 DUF4395 domain-containing protein [Halomonas campisalis]MDR5861805.1 DUF4395 domain-containing protein [Halomonas campisalis]